MAEKNGIYRCEVCGNVVSVIEAKQGELVCCEKPMILLEEKTQEQEGNEKHVPVLENAQGKVIVKVGTVPHPMEAEHHIELIQIMKEGKMIAEKKLYPGDEPKAEFCGLDNAQGLKARALCNVHGLWKG